MSLVFPGAAASRDTVRRGHTHQPTSILGVVLMLWGLSLPITSLRCQGAGPRQVLPCAIWCQKGRVHTMSLLSRQTNSRNDDLHYSSLISKENGNQELTRERLSPKSNKDPADHLEEPQTCLLSGEECPKPTGKGRPTTQPAAKLACIPPPLLYHMCTGCMQGYYSCPSGIQGPAVETRRTTQVRVGGGGPGGRGRIPVEQHLSWCTWACKSREGGKGAGSPGRRKSLCTARWGRRARDPQDGVFAQQRESAHGQRQAAGWEGGAAQAMSQTGQWGATVVRPHTLLSPASGVPGDVDSDRGNQEITHRRSQATNSSVLT